MLNEPGRFYPYPCNYELNTFFNWKFCTSFFCETTIYKSKPSSQIKVKSFPKQDKLRLSKQLDSAIVQCANEEWTKTVLTCDSAGPCETKTPLNLCTLFVITNSDFYVDNDKTDDTSNKRNFVSTINFQYFRSSASNNASFSKTSQLGRAEEAQMKIVFQMFECKLSGDYISYSLVCDFIPHCPGKTDEQDCFHGHKTGYRYILIMFKYNKL